MKIIFPFLIVLFYSLQLTAQTPVAYYPFSGNANDVAGSLHGTVNGATLTTDRFGNANSAYSFDGVDDAISFTGLPMTNNDNFTLMAWVNPAVFSAANQFNKMIVSIGPGSNGYNMGMGNNSGSGGGNELGGLYNLVAWLHSGSFFSSINTWYHVAMVRENGVTKFYLNAVAGPITSNATPAAPTAAFQIGGQDFDPSHFWNGKIDEVKIYNVALTAAQVQLEYGLSNQVQKPGSGNTINFDGFDDGVEVANSTSLQFPGDLSVECWVKIPVAQNNTANPDNAIIEKWAGNNSGIGYPFTIRYIKSTHSVSFARYNGAASVGVDGIAVVDDNKWHHIAATKTGNSLSLYIDGILQGAGIDLADLTNVNNTQNLNIGSRGPIASSPNQLTGAIDEIRIWNVGMSQTEIRDRMCRKITASDPLFSSLLAYYNFDESSGTALIDGSVNANDGVLANNPARVTSGAAIGNSSAHNYTGAASSINLSNPVRGDAFTATLTAGSAAGLQVYCVTEVPNTTNGQVPVAGNDGYFGVFPINGTGNQYTATYNYTGIAGDENTFTLYKRNDNATTAWNNALAVLNTTANTLTATGQNTEYMVGALATGNISLSGALTGEYATLKEAFDAINAGGGSGAVTATVNNNTTETVQAILNQTGYTVQVVPTGNRIIEGNLAAAMILLNGADNVIFDGQTLTGSNTLTLRNTGTATASVVRLLDAASNNIIRKCIIEGSGNGTTVTQGVLVINVTNLGNSDGNIIDSNIVRRASASGVSIGIIVAGTNNAATSLINNTRITNNSIENVFINNQTSFGIALQSNCSNSIIKGNSVYNTVQINNTVNGISFNGISANTRGNALGSGVIIDSNFVGGSAPGCGGSKMTISSPNNNFTGFMIVVSDNTTGNTSSVTRNTVNNLDINVSNPGTGTANPLSAINVQNGKLQAFNNNTVGSIINSTVTVTMKPSSTGAIGCFAMLIQTNCATPVENNFVGGIEITSSSSGGSAVGPFFVGIDTRNGISNNIKKNIIGSASGGNIFVANTATGIFNLQMIASSAALDAALINIDSNTIRSVNASHTSVAAIGYSNSNTAATSATAVITGNSITDLTVTGASSVINGISYSTIAGVTNLTHTLTAKNNLVNNLLGIFGSGNSLRGINISNSSTAVNRIKGRIENNTVANFTNIASTTTGFSRAITMNNDIIIGDSMVLAGNIINNIIDDGATVLTDASLSSFGNSSGMVVLMPNSSTNGTAVVRDNQIHSIITSASDIAPIKVHAISVFGNAVIIERNKIYDLRNAATSASASLAPILLRSRPDDANTAVIRNNMIAVNTTTAAQMAGIKTMDGTVKANIYHNSILLEGSSTNNSYALLKDAVIPVVDVKNNILYNAVTGSGTPFAIGLAGTTSGYTGNNNYFVSGAPNALSQVDITSHTLTGWQAATSQDAATQQGQAAVTTNAVSLFVNKAAGDLLINTSNATEPVKLNNNGLALSGSVPFDFLNTVRNASTPDIGAHEFVFTPPLPLTLLSFTGTKERNDTKLQWTTANEINVKRYEVQRSDNGRDFVTIGMATSGNSLYTYIDANVFVSKSLVYYRLKSIDNDGRFTYSNMIRLSSQAAAIVSIFPNPVKDVVTVGGLKQQGTITLFDAGGKLLQQQMVTAQTVTIDMSNYAKGMYLLQYRVDGEIISQKVIKQ